MKRLEPYYGRIELYAALAALGLAVIAGVYLTFTTMVEKEACYGISGAKVVCQPLTGANAVEQSAACLSSSPSSSPCTPPARPPPRRQAAPQAPDARLTAYMILLTCALTVFGITFPAISGVGFSSCPA